MSDSPFAQQKPPADPWQQQSSPNAADVHPFAGPTQDPVEAQKDRILEIIRSQAALSESSEVALFAGQVMHKIKELGGDA